MGDHPRFSLGGTSVCSRTGLPKPGLFWQILVRYFFFLRQVLRVANLRILWQTFTWSCLKPQIRKKTQLWKEKGSFLVGMPAQFDVCWSVDLGTVRYRSYLHVHGNGCFNGRSSLTFEVDWRWCFSQWHLPFCTWINSHCTVWLGWIADPLLIWIGSKLYCYTPWEMSIKL